MLMEKINTEEEFKHKLDEIGQIFGVKFNLTDRDVYMTNESGKTVKMDTNGYYYCGFLNGKKICMKYMFEPHCFSTSALIEIFSSDGKKRDCCRIEQELQPQSGIGSYPTFTYNSYQDGKTYLFYSNSVLLETCITSGVNIHMFEAIKKYENNNNIKSVDRLAARFNKPNITRFLCGVDNRRGECCPQAQFEKCIGHRGHNYKISILEGDCKIYQDISYSYKYNPEGFFAIIPFFECEYLGEKQYLESVNDLTQEDWNNLFLSIIQNREAIKCFEDTINYFNNTSASSYIYKYFSTVIELVRGLQGGTINKEISFDKVITKSLPKIQK